MRLTPLYFALAVCVCLTAIANVKREKSAHLNQTKKTAANGVEAAIPNQCSLAVGPTALRPVGAGVDPNETWLGDIGVAVSGSNVTARDANGAVIWGEMVPSHGAVVLVAGDDELLYFVEEDIFSDVVYRLQRKNGTLRSSLHSSMKSPKTCLFGVVAGNGHVVLASGSDTKGYVIDCFKQEGSTPVWSKSVGSAKFARFGELDYRSYLLRDPTRRHEALTPLVLGNGCVIASADKELPIVAYALSDGSEHWNLANIWEYRRGYMGASVYSYYISRFGLMEPSDPKQVETVRAREPYKGELIAGPYAVSFGPEHGTDPRTGKEATKHLFFVCGIRESYLVADEFMYEVNESGRVITITPLPHSLVANPVAVDDELVLPLDKDALMRIRTSDEPVDMGMGPWKNKPDYVGDVISLNKPTMPQSQTWLTATLDKTPVAEVGDLSVRPIARPYIETQSSTDLHVPIGIVRAKNGGCLVGELTIPFSHVAGKPATNFSFDGKRWDLVVPWDLEIERIDQMGGNLRFVIKGEKQAWFVDFSSSDLQRAVSRT